MGLVGGVTSQREQYIFSSNKLNSVEFSQTSQEFSGWGPEIGFKLKWKIADTISLSNSLTYIHTENNYKYSTLYFTPNFQYSIFAYSDFDNPVVKVNANNNGFAKGVLQTDGFRNFTNFEFPLSEDVSFNFGVMILTRKITITDFGYKELFFNRSGINYDIRNGNEQYILSYLFYDNIKKQNSWYSSITVGLSLRY